MLKREQEKSSRNSCQTNLFFYILTALLIPILAIVVGVLHPEIRARLGLASDTSPPTTTDPDFTPLPESTLIVSPTLTGHSPTTTTPQPGPNQTLVPAIRLQSDEFPPIVRGVEVVAICLNRAEVDLSNAAIWFAEMNEVYSLDKLFFSEKGQTSQCGCLEQKEASERYPVPQVCDEENTVFSDVADADWRNSTIKLLLDGVELVNCPPQRQSLSDDTYACSW